MVQNARVSVKLTAAWKKRKTIIAKKRDKEMTPTRWLTQSWKGGKWVNTDHSDWPNTKYTPFWFPKLSSPFPTAPLPDYHISPSWFPQFPFLITTFPLFDSNNPHPTFATNISNTQFRITPRKCPFWNHYDLNSYYERHTMYTIVNIRCHNEGPYY